MEGGDFSVKYGAHGGAGQFTRPRDGPRRACRPGGVWNTPGAMMFSNHRDSVTGLLILRHLHTGNVIDHPAPEALPQARILKILEENGLIERWNRVWPMTDRYRLTEKGAQVIQGAFRPEGAEAIFQQLRSRNLPPPPAQAPSMRSVWTRITGPSSTTRTPTG